MTQPALKAKALCELANAPSDSSASVGARNATRGDATAKHANVS